MKRIRCSEQIQGLLCTAGIIALSIATGCGGGPGPKPAPPEGGGSSPDPDGHRIKIAVIPKGTTHEFWKTVEAGALKAEEELDVRVTWVGPTKEDDRAQQIEVVETQILNRMDGIVLAPLDAEALRRPVQEAVAQKVPVVIFDSGLNNSDDLVVSFVATDNYKGGVMAAQRMAQILDGTGNVIMLRYQAGSQSTENREKGFLETLAKEFPGIKVLSENQRATSDINEAKLKSTSMLLKFKSQLDGVFTVCEPHNKGMLAALEDNKLTTKVKFVAFDSSPRMIEGLGKDTVHGVVLQDPVNMGYVAVKTMAAHLAGETVEKRISTGEYVATAENKDEKKIASVLAPEKHAP